MKKILLLITLFVLLISGVLAADFTLTTPSTITLNENSNGNSFFNIQNGNETITNVQISTNTTASDLTDGTNAITVTYNPVSFSNITNDTTQTVNINVSIPQDIDIGTYKAVVNVISGSISKSTTLDIIVDPNVCSEGKQGSDLSVDIQSPDSGDDFKPGDIIDVEVDVSNDGSDDLDVKVEASLWDLDKGKKIAYVRSDEQNINEDDEETFNLQLKLTYTGFDEDNNYKLFVKAYESGNEDDNCNYNSQSQNLELSDDEVVIEKLVLIPTIVECGEQVTATVDVLNIGTNDQDDVYVQILNSELKLDKSSSAFSLGQYGDSDDDATETFTFNIPEDAAEKDYSITAIVHSDGPDNSQSQTLKVTCADSVQTATTASNSGSLSIPSSIRSASIGSILPLNYVITNSASASQTYTLEFTPLGAWASPATQTVTVGSGQASSFNLNIPVSSNVAEGTYSASIKLLSSGNVLDSKPLSIELLKSNAESEPNKFTGKTVLDNLKIGNIPLAFWLVLDVILALLIVILAYLLLRK